MWIILSCHKVPVFFFASLQIPYTKWGTSLRYMLMWSQQPLTMFVFPNSSKDRSAANTSTPLKKRIPLQQTSLCCQVSTCENSLKRNALKQQVYTHATSWHFLQKSTHYTSSQTEFKRDAKATWVAGPHCNLTQNGSSDRMSFLPIE